MENNNTDIQRLFVYGSLRSGFRNPAYQYISDFFELQGDALVHGKFFDKGPYPVAAPTDEEVFIQGELYNVKDNKDFEWVIAQLDDYEGLNVEPNETPSYRRDRVEVLLNGNKFTAWIYWYNGSTNDMEEIITGDILKYLQEKIKKN